MKINSRNARSFQCLYSKYLVNFSHVTGDSREKGAKVSPAQLATAIFVNNLI